MKSDRASVLIADDDAAICELLKDLLSDKYDVHLTHNGDDALNHLKDQDKHFDILLLDIMMPQLNGYQVLSKLTDRFLPVLILSAKSDPLDQIKGLSLGAWGYSTKPFNKDILMTQIQNLTRLGQLLRINNRQMLDEKKKRVYAEQRLFSLKQDLAEAKNYILQLRSK
ncbi:MAG: response regulator, partial [Spirochaetota bacterium]|nr:response regulator [Spirochaetota bacterium]